MNACFAKIQTSLWCFWMAFFLRSLWDCELICLEFLSVALNQGLSMIGYETGKIILKFPSFCQLNLKNQKQENSKYYKYFRISIFYFLLSFLVCKIKEWEFQIFILYPIFKHSEKLNRFLKNYNLCKSKCALLKEWKNKKKKWFWYYFTISNALSLEQC